LLKIAGQKPQRLTRFDRRSSENNAIDLLFLQGGDGHRHCQIGLAGASWPNPEDHVVLLDRVEIISLPKGAGDNRWFARRSNNLSRDKIAQIIRPCFVHGVQGVIELMPLNIGSALPRAFQLRKDPLGFRDLLQARLRA
jgi:hypothetical protein